MIFNKRIRRRWSPAVPGVAGPSVGAVIATLTTLAIAASLLVACAPAALKRTDSPGTLRVVAAESVWGSIAAQLGGPRVTVRNIIESPAVDPHDYEPTADDARAMALADVVVVNGLGYDPWARALLAPGALGRRVVVDVGHVVGGHLGDNPHRWYNPDDVRAVAGAITAAYQQVNPAQSAYFAQRLTWFETTALGEYHRLITEIRTTFSGTPIGASESIFEMLIPALGLDLLTPPGFLRAISEGTEATTADRRTATRQLADHAVRLYLYNSQNATPEVRDQVALARREGIPVVSMTEMLSPPSATYQAWQTTQLRALLDALEQTR